MVFDDSEEDEEFLAFDTKYMIGKVVSTNPLRNMVAKIVPTKTHITT